MDVVNAEQAKIAEEAGDDNSRRILVIKLEQGIIKRSDFGFRTGTKDFKTGFYKGTDRVKAGTMVEYRPTRPFVDALSWNGEST